MGTGIREDRPRPKSEWWTVTVVGGKLGGQTLKKEFCGKEMRNYLRSTEWGVSYEVYEYHPYNVDTHTATATYIETVEQPWLEEEPPPDS